MRLVASLLAVFATGLLTACGGGDAEPSPKARFLARADGLCGTLATQTRKLAERTFEGPTPSASDRAAYEQEATALQRGTLGKLRALTPPPGDEVRVKELLDALEAGIATTADLAPDDPGVAAGTGRFEQLARDYGLKVCGGTPS